MTKFDNKIQKEIKQVTKPGVKSFEGVDLDVMLSIILDEFLECRGKIMKNLKNKYFKIYEVDRGRMIS